MCEVRWTIKYLGILVIYDENKCDYWSYMSAVRKTLKHLLLCAWRQPATMRLDHILIARGQE